VTATNEPCWQCNDEPMEGYICAICHRMGRSPVAERKD
jgi:hypothetical protein